MLLAYIEWEENHGVRTYPVWEYAERVLQLCKAVQGTKPSLGWEEIKDSEVHVVT